jgi:predicted flap endonuclease-1-like 5' DNA nuclease
MRLDYALYGLAVILFAATVGVFFSLSNSSNQLICTVSTAVLGILCACVGFVVKPKTQAVTSTAPSTPLVQAAPKQPEPTPEPPQAVTPPPQPPAPPAPIVESPKEEQLPPAEPVQAEPPAVTEPAKAEMPAAPETKPEPEAPAPPPVAEVPAVPAPAPAAPEEASSAPSELTKIHGINQKRVDQLKANGINTLQELANASAEDLAAKLAVSPRIVKMWIGSAKKQIK